LLPLALHLGLLASAVGVALRLLLLPLLTLQFCLLALLVALRLLSRSLGVPLRLLLLPLLLAHLLLDVGLLTLLLRLPARLFHLALKLLLLALELLLLALELLLPLLLIEGVGRALAAVVALARESRAVPLAVSGASAVAPPLGGRVIRAHWQKTEDRKACEDSASGTSLGRKNDPRVPPQRLRNQEHVTHAPTHTPAKEL
jgi:hypothetical protein